MRCLLLALAVVSIIHQGSCQETSKVSCLTSPSSQFITPHGSACCFPFVFEDRIFYSCTDFKHTQPWCSATSEYSGKWGNCIAVSQGTRTTVSPPTGPCSFAYTLIRDTNSWNGRLMPGNATDIVSCRNYCDNEGLSCAGFDYDAVQVPNRCYLHTDFTILQRNSGNAVGITQYVKEGSCFYKSAENRNTCFKIMRSNTHSVGGTEIVGINKLASCMDACALSNNCLGFDFRRDDGRCFIHVNSLFRNQVNREGVDQYEKTACT